MYLKEFDLDLPDVPAKRREFNVQTRCITAFFERCFGKFKTENCWKILVECVSEVTNPKLRDLLGAYTIQVEANAEDFFKAEPLEKKKWALDTLMKGIGRVTKETQWDPRPFNEAAQAIRDSGYMNVWFWKKPRPSPSRKLIGRVMCEHDINALSVWLIIEDKRGTEITRKKVVSEVPHEFAYAKHLGSTQWASETEFVLINEKGNERWSVRAEA